MWIIRWLNPVKHPRLDARSLRRRRVIASEELWNRIDNVLEMVRQRSPSVYFTYIETYELLHFFRINTSNFFSRSSFDNGWSIEIPNSCILSVLYILVRSATSPEIGWRASSAVRVALLQVTVTLSDVCLIIVRLIYYPFELPVPNTVSWDMKQPLVNVS